MFSYVYSILLPWPLGYITLSIHNLCFYAQLTTLLIFSDDHKAGGGELAPWPARLTSPPPRLADFGYSNDMFEKDTVCRTSLYHLSLKLSLPTLIGRKLNSNSSSTYCCPFYAGNVGTQSWELLESSRFQDPVRYFEECDGYEGKSRIICGSSEEQGCLGNECCSRRWTKHT